MAMINDLDTELSSRYGEDMPKEGNNTVFADLIIDSISLFKRLKQYDFVPAFGWGDFYIEHNNQSRDIGPFHFKWDNYKSAIEQAYEIGRLR